MHNIKLILVMTQVLPNPSIGTTNYQLVSSDQRRMAHYFDRLFPCLILYRCFDTLCIVKGALQIMVKKKKDHYSIICSPHGVSESPAKHVL